MLSSFRARLAISLFVRTSEPGRRSHAPQPKSIQAIPPRVRSQPNRDLHHPSERTRSISVRSSFPETSKGLTFCAFPLEGQHIVSLTGHSLKSHLPQFNLIPSFIRNRAYSICAYTSCIGLRTARYSMKVTPAMQERNGSNVTPN